MRVFTFPEKSVFLAIVFLLSMVLGGAWPGASLNASANEQSAAGAGTSEAYSFEWDGLDRRYLVYTPTGYDGSAPLPVVMAFHGGTGWAERFERTSGLDEMADEFGFLVVYGEGTPVNRLFGNVWNAGDCCARAGDAYDSVDDVGYVREVVRRGEASYSVDSDRVYATGMSNGAMLVHRLACEASDLFAGFAAVSGTIQVDECDPSRPVPMLMMHGTEDTSVPYEGGVGSGAGQVVAIPVETLFQDWAERNSCSGISQTRSVDALERGVFSVDQFDALGCTEPVRLLRVNGGPHSWFGGDRVAMTRSGAKASISSPEAIVEFFDL